jgi:hypothetical protein
LSETIGGLTDTTGPTVTVLAPAANASLQFGDTVNVQVQASDAGTGFKEVRIQGLGYDDTHSASEFVSGTLTVPITVPDIASPATLTVTGKDNKGNTTAQTVTGLQIQVPGETEPNDSIAGAAQTLVKNSPLQGTIQNADSATTFPAGLANMFANGYSGQKTVEDFYKVVCCDRIMDNDNFFILGRRITVEVDFSVDSALQPDIDVYLLNSSGVVIASSTADNRASGVYKETLVAGGVATTVFNAASEGQTFYVAVQAWNVPSRTRYRVERQ